VNLGVDRVALTVLYMFVGRRGVSSIVRRCVEKVTNREFAVKIIDLTTGPEDEASGNDPSTMREATLKEIRILRLCANHRHISESQSILNSTYLKPYISSTYSSSSMGAVTFSEEGWQELNRCGSNNISLTFPPLLSSLPTLDLMLLVGKNASLPTQITKYKTRFVSNNFYC